jgi:division protein CdvB (Snf7/Vps24/ESCRT-III family)
MVFRKKWTKTQTQNVSDKVVQAIKHTGSLKPKIEEAQRKLQLQISKLDSITSKMDHKNEVLFERILQCVQSHETQHAKILSCELSHIRKMSKMVRSARITLEQIQLRLNTVTELGDVVVTLSPTASLIKGIRGGLSSMIPDADKSFSHISDILSSIMCESGQHPITEITGSIALNEDSCKIVEEANTTVQDITKK